MKAFSANRRQHARSVFVPVLLASTALTGISLPAVAQDSAAGLEVVTVTAQKREENLQRVPLSVSVLGEARLSELHVVNADDYVKFLPSVSSQSLGPGFLVIHMRGVSSGENNNHSGPLPTVGTYLDEQPITTINGTLDFPFFDISRIEALAGPQGTLYGASSEAGTLRIITNKPDPSRFEANYQVEINTVAHGDMGYLAEGMVNYPLNDKLALRIVAWEQHDGGYIDNVHGSFTYPTSGALIDNSRLVEDDFNDVNKLGARGQLLYNWNDNWTITAMLMGQTEKADGIFGFDPNVGDLEVIRYHPDTSRDRWYQAALTVQGKIGNIDLTYSGGHMDRRLKTASDYTEYSFYYDLYGGYGAYWVDNTDHPPVVGSHVLDDPSQVVIGKDHFTKDSHELRFASPGDRRFRWVAGLFYEQQTHKIEQRYLIRGLNSDLWVGGQPDTWWLTLQDRTDRDYAAFGEASFDIFPDLTFTAGIRGYSYDNDLVGFFGFSQGTADMGYSSTGEAGCFTGPIVEGTPCTDLNRSAKGTGETHKANFSWRIDEDHMIYVTYSTGFRPGGINRRSEFGTYASDNLSNYEFGWKTTWADGRIRWNGAIFDEEWAQFQFAFLPPSSNSFTIVANAGSAQIQGVETDVSILPFDGLTITASGAWTDAKLTSPACNRLGHCPDPGAVPPVEELAPKGTRLPVTPEWKFAGTIRYDALLWEGWTGHVQSSVTYQSDSSPTLPVAENAILGVQEAFTAVDFSLGVDSDQWSIEAFALNAFDERGQLSRYSACTVGICPPKIVVTRPRTIGLRVGQRF